jgi:hypothetical protein
MFDPSKLDLDLDENLEKKSKQTPKASESDKITESKKSIPKEIVSTESKEDSDFLGNLMSDNNDLLENKKIESLDESKKDIQKNEEPELL